MESKPLVSVIIPTYNRFKYLLNAIESVKDQTYPNIEIIVVNDASTQPEYYSHKFEGITFINLPINSKKTFGFACAGHVRNEGIKISTGKYIAFLDDDDIWLPCKLELQIKEMQETGCKMSCTDGYIGHGQFNINNRYKLYHAEHYINDLKNIFSNKNSSLLINGIPKIFNRDLLLQVVL